MPPRRLSGTEQSRGAAEARPRRGRGRAATARGTHRKGDAGGEGLNTLHGTAPRPLPCPLHGAPSRSNPIPPYRTPTLTVESECLGAASSATKVRMPYPRRGNNRCTVDRRCNPPLLRERVQLYGCYLQHTLISRQTANAVRLVSPRGGPRPRVAFVLMLAPGRAYLRFGPSAPSLCSCSVTAARPCSRRLVLVLAISDSSLTRAL